MVGTAAAPMSGVLILLGAGLLGTGDGVLAYESGLGEAMGA